HIDSVEITAIRTALQQYQAISQVFRPPAADSSPSLRRLKQQVRYLWISFQRAHYPTLGRGLPALLLDAQGATSAYPSGTDDGLTARMLASQSYQLAASTLWKLKEVDLAWIAAERALMLAEQTSDSLLISDAARRVAQGLMATGHH